MKKSKPSEIEDDGQFDDLIDNDPVLTLHNRVESYERERSPGCTLLSNRVEKAQKILSKEVPMIFRFHKCAGAWRSS
jgi:hypothetical protein